MDQDIKVTVDAIVLRPQKENIYSVLLIRRKNPPFKGKWALPGGFVENDEDLEIAALRELEEETGISLDNLSQLHTFGTPGRDPRSRTISIAYYGFLNREEKQNLRADTDASEARWFNIKKLPELAFDHEEILRVAMDRVKNDLGIN